jgi:hypothetical protein
MSQSRVVTVRRDVLDRLIAAADSLTEACNDSADFGDHQGRGTEEEADALTECEDAIAEMRKHIE